MKKISTYLFRLSLLSILFMAFSASAEEYKSMIRYDRVWECVSSKWFVNSVNYIRFDGTEEINGKIYHKLVTFRKAGFDFDYDNDYKIYLYDELDDINEHEGYLREENGIVYTLVAHNGSEDAANWMGQLYVPTEDYGDFTYVTEEVIYDFNCKEEVAYGGITFVERLAIKDSFTVKSVDSIEVGGEQCRRFMIANEFGIEYPVIEGIGAASNGCLNTHAFLGGPTYPYSYHELNRVFDNDGNVLYATEEDYMDIPHGNLARINCIIDKTSPAAPMFDVLGRRISHPAPGQLYIQGGKKHIAR